MGAPRSRADPVFNLDPKILARLGPELARVIVFDPQPAAAKLVGELLKDVGARQIVYAPDTAGGLELIAHVDPQLIFTEMSGAGFDGADLTARLRRSTLPARQVPVIVVSGEATVESIKSARDSGAHEFLRKPYAAKDLHRRVENVILNPRLWIEAKVYVGPDRRRFNSGEFKGARRRKADEAPTPAEMLAATG